MGKHLHEEREHAWRVGVDGRTRGAGVLLDERHVLTCAHVAGDENERIEVASTVCRPEWRSTARVAPGSWAYRGGDTRRGDTRRGDVALLLLDPPAPCDAGTRLWCAPISGGRVRAHGFPRAEPYGMPADAELAGDGGRGGELGLLNRVRAGAQWIEPGFSGAGVMVLDGDHAGHVIGIIVADFQNADAKAAWMIPTETIREYLQDHVAPFVAGEPTYHLEPAGGGLPELAHGDTLRVALTQELTRLLSSGWTGTVVLPGGGTSTGTGWLVRLVRTADPATRAGTSEHQLRTAPRDTVLGLGKIDAAYDARGRSVAEITRYLADRFGLPPGEPDLVRRLLRRVPPACLVIVGVDRARSGGELIREVLRPLAVAARSRGVRLVLGFDGPLPGKELPYKVVLDPAPVTGTTGTTGTTSTPGTTGTPGTSRHSVTAAGAEARIAELAEAEEEAARLASENQRRFREPPRLPPATAPRLRVRLAVARRTLPDPELAAIYDKAGAALGETESVIIESRLMDERLQHLRQTLEVNRERAARYFGAEDTPLAGSYNRAARAVWQAPIDLRAAAAPVEEYIAEVQRRIDSGDADHG